MNSNIDSQPNEFSFTEPAVYQIKVQGDIAEIWSNRLGGMQITVVRKRDQKPVSLLIGRMTDQSELSGVLNSLFELHLPVISVKVLKDVDEKR